MILFCCYYVQPVSTFFSCTFLLPLFISTYISIFIRISSCVWILIIIALSMERICYCISLLVKYSLYNCVCSWCILNLELKSFKPVLSNIHGFANITVVHFNIFSWACVRFQAIVNWLLVLHYSRKALAVPLSSAMAGLLWAYNYCKLCGFLKKDKFICSICKLMYAYSMCVCVFFFFINSNKRIINIH